MSLLPGLRDPVRDSQALFRALLEAMAEPARPVAMPFDGEVPTPLAGGAAGLLLTLSDPDTSVHIVGIDEETRQWIAFHTGAPETCPETARFVVCDADAMPDIATLAQGDAAYPDRSATLIVQVADFDGDEIVFDGPGFDRPRPLATAWPEGFAEQWRANGKRFPLGVDVVLVSRTHVAGLPRTARIV